MFFGCLSYIRLFCGISGNRILPAVEKLIDMSSGFGGITLQYGLSLEMQGIDGLVTAFAARLQRGSGPPDNEVGYLLALIEPNTRPQWATEFVVRSAGLIRWGGRWSKRFCKTVVRELTCKRAKDFVMQQYGHSGPQTLQEWRIAALLFKELRGDPNELFSVFPVKVRPQLGPQHEKYLDAIYMEAMTIW
jgi:hypothetical protein